MKERPILFSGSMVRAILDGSKTQTRRIVKKVPEIMNQRNEFCVPLPSPYGVTGDRLWVRETGWERPERTARMMREGADTWKKYYYDADGYNNDGDHEQFKAWGFKRRPSIFMPRWASRITLEVTDVRVQRLQEISDDDVQAEGFPRDDSPPHDGTRLNANGRRILFNGLWDDINGERAPWASNPWVWCVTFSRVTQ